MNTNKNMVSRALCMLRTYHHLSPSELADKLGVAEGVVLNIENGSDIAEPEIVEKYAEIFKVRASDIMLFAEPVGHDFTTGEKIRIFVADKILRVLEWIERK
jgi:transcriptional regulator with XRE-family HTH domain